MATYQKKKKSAMAMVYVLMLQMSCQAKYLAVPAWLGEIINIQALPELNP